MSSASASALSPLDRASFATSSRLLSCLITESLLKAIFVPTRPSPQDRLVGTAVVLNPLAGGDDACYIMDDVFAIIPLRSIPIFKPKSDTVIALLDPLDMLPYVYLPFHDVKPCLAQGDSTQSEKCLSWEHQLRLGLSQIVSGTAHMSLVSALGPLHLWTKFADAFNIPKEMQEAVAEELRSSVAWQEYSYEHPPQHPVFESPSIIWEQCIIGGHPTHPMHKARRAMHPIPPIHPGDYDWQHPQIRIVAAPRATLSIQGAWDDLVAPVCEAAAKTAGKPLNNFEDHAFIPVHAIQIPNIREKFPEATVLPEEYHVNAFAQQSLRSVLVPSALPTLSLKLALGVRLTSAIRTISPPSAFLGPRFSREVVPRLTYDRALLIVQREIASVWHVHSDQEVAKHLGCIVREAYENTCAEEHGERAIVCTALVETGYGGSVDREVPLVQLVFGLDTEEKRIAWFDRFVDVFFKAFLPPVIVNGVAFEAHPQNTLARFDAQTRQLKGFVIRDFGGLRIHPPTLLATTGLQTLDDGGGGGGIGSGSGGTGSGTGGTGEGIIKPGHSVVANTLADVHARLYHTLIHNHLQQLIRVLGIHHSGAGWKIVRHRLSEQIPLGHELHTSWLGPESETVPGKCFMRMRMQGMYRTHLHSPFPNLIHYAGTTADRPL